MKALEKNKAGFIVIDFSVFTVHEYTDGLKTGFKKASAYKVCTSLFELVLPYRGNFRDFEGKRPPGIYSGKKGNTHRFILPSKGEYEQYGFDQIKGVSTSIFSNGNFVKGDVIIDTEGDIFKPRINSDDDLNLKLLKTAINLKNISLSSYDNRFQNIDIGTNPSNRKSNAKKAIVNNNSLSSNKLVQLGDVMDLDIAVVIRDKPGSYFPMSIDKPIAIFSGPQFDLGKAINISTLDFNKLYEVPEE